MAFPNPKPQAAIESLRQRAKRARERAASCEARAARHEALLSRSDEGAQKPLAAMRDVLDRAGSRHLISAQMHEMLAVRLEAWHNSGGADVRPMVMDAIVAQLGMASALVKLGQHNALAIAVSSDQTARAAHDLELVTAEGPLRTLSAALSSPLLARICSIGGPVMAQLSPSWAFRRYARLRLARLRWASEHCARMTRFRQPRGTPPLRRN